MVWKAGKITGGFASPVYHQGRLYGLTQVTVNCVDAARRQGDLEAARRRARSAASPVIADGKLYAVNTKGRTFVVQLGDKPKLLASNELDDVILRHAGDRQWVHLPAVRQVSVLHRAAAIRHPPASGQAPVPCTPEADCDRCRPLPPAR